MSLLASRVMANFESTFGYPPGTNELVRAGGDSGRRAVEMLSAAGLSGDLLDFYARVERATFPDVGNGFFIHSAEDVVGGIRDGQPTRVTGALNDRVTVFGSDGGGGLFALTEANKVYRLDGGSLIGAVYDVDESGVEEIASDLWGFLEYFRGEASAVLPSNRN